MEKTDSVSTQNSHVAIDFLTNGKFLITLCSLVIISTGFIIYRRIMLNWVGSDESITLVSYAHALMMGIPLYLCMMMYASFYYPKARWVKWLNRITDLKILAPICYVGMLVSFICFIANVPVLVGSWTTDAMVFASMLLLVYFLHGKVSNLLAFIATIGILGMWSGYWEIPYQTGLKIYYDLPQIGWNRTFEWIKWEWTIEILTAGVGTWIVWELNKRFHFVHFNKWFFIFFGIYIACMVYWFATGYWVENYYDWSIEEWVQKTDFQWGSLFACKISKVFMMFGFISLVWRKNS